MDKEEQKYYEFLDNKIVLIKIPPKEKRKLKVWFRLEDFMTDAITCDLRDGQFEYELPANFNKKIIRIEFE